MRGKIGYKKPLAGNVAPALRATYLDNEVLTFTPPGEDLRMTYLDNDVLTFMPAAQEARLTYLDNDVLTYMSAAQEARLSYFDNDVLTYPTAATETRLSYFDNEVITYVPTVPYPPSGLTATPIDGGAFLTWYAAYSSGIPPADYTVQYSSDDGQTWTTANASPITGTSYTITGLTNNQIYLFRARSSNSVGTGNWSAYSNYVIPSPNSWQTTFLGPTTGVGVTPANSFTEFTLVNVDSVTTAGDLIISFLCVASNAPNPNDTTATCNTTTPGQNGASISGCGYSYEFQSRQVDPAPAVPTWTTVYTGSYYDDNGIVRPGTRYPFEYKYFRFPGGNLAISAASVATNAQLPGSANIGALYFVQNTQQVLVWNGNAWSAYYRIGYTYQFRCIITRKSDGVKNLTTPLSRIKFN